MVLIAFSLQAEVEKYGAYVGIAAFFGLAILSLLYFAQAREVKRLREWAGRAPERAAELEMAGSEHTDEGRRGPASPPAGGRGGAEDARLSARRGGSPRPRDARPGAAAGRAGAPAVGGRGARHQ